MIRGKKGLVCHNRPIEGLNLEARPPHSVRKIGNSIQRMKFQGLAFHYPGQFKRLEMFKPGGQNLDLNAYLREFRIQNLQKKQPKPIEVTKRSSFSPCQNLRAKYMKRRPSLTLMSRTQELNYEVTYKEPKTEKNHEAFKEACHKSFHIKRTRVGKKGKHTNSTLSSCPAEEEIGENTKCLIEQLTTYEIKFRVEHPAKADSLPKRIKEQ